MRDMIRIEPAAERRQGFAAWAVAQIPKVRTVGPNTFAVPAGLFADAPEDILIGARVDGHRYVSPDEEAAQERPASGSSELVGVATPDGFRGATSGEALPPAPDDAYGSDSKPLPEPDTDDSSNTSTPEGVFPCGGCDRDFTSERGRNLHRRQAHPEN